MKDGGVPGLSIALLRDAERVWRHGFGVKNTKTNEPVADDTVFEAASLSKPVFAYAVLKLLDAGKFDRTSRSTNICRVITMSAKTRAWGRLPRVTS